MIRYLKNALIPAALAAAVAWSAPAGAAPVVDQEQLLYNNGMPFHFGVGSSNLPMGQSFTAGLSGRLDRLDLFSNGQRSSANSVTLEIRAGEGTGGSLLGSIDLVLTPNSPDPVTLDWLDEIDVSSLDILVSAGSQYTFVFTAADLGTRSILGHTGNPYAGGRAFFGPTGYGDQPEWDLTFRTYVSEVPAPPVLAIFVLGLFAAGRLRRR
jgi:hypothetical protein